MTRKITFGLVLLILVLIAYEIVFGSNALFRKGVASVKELKAASRKLKTSATQLENKADIGFDEKKKNLKKAIKDYNETKQEYEELIPKTISADELLEESQTKDSYDVGFLWTIVGNYATEAGITLKFDVEKNLTSLASMNNTSDEYVVCDLKFTTSGSYINLTDFIYSLENDDRLGFEINDFLMEKGDEDLRVTLNIKEIKVKKSNLLESAIQNTINNATDAITDATSTTTSTTDSTNTASAGNTASSSNTTNSTQSIGNTVPTN